jgi:hypothetical protein
METPQVPHASTDNSRRPITRSQSRLHQVLNHINDECEEGEGTSAVPFVASQSANDSTFWNDIRNRLAHLNDDTHSALNQNQSLDEEEACCATPCYVNNSHSSIPLEWTECSNCHKWFHNICVNIDWKHLTPEEIEAIEWLCHNCVNLAPSQSSNTTYQLMDFTDIAYLWIQEHLTTLSNSSIPKKDVWTSFQRDTGMKCSSIRTRLGKMMANIFPEVKTKRLGHRGKSYYAFIGLTWTASLSSNETANSVDWGTKLAALRTQIPTLRRVRKGARKDVAEIFTRAINTAITSNTDNAYGNLFLLPYQVLAVPRKEDKVTNLTSWVRERVRNLEAGLPVKFTPRGFTPSLTKDDQDKSIGKKIEAKLSDGDTKGACRLINSEDNIAPNNAETRNKYSNLRRSP